jgi:hypothetical protein
MCAVCTYKCATCADLYDVSTDVGDYPSNNARTRANMHAVLAHTTCIAIGRLCCHQVWRAKGDRSNCAHTYTREQRSRTAYGVCILNALARRTRGWSTNNSNNIIIYCIRICVNISDNISVSDKIYIYIYIYIYICVLILLKRVRLYDRVLPTQNTDRARNGRIRSCPTSSELHFTNLPIHTAFVCYDHCLCAGSK